MSPYFYQFHVNDSRQLDIINHFLDKQRFPLTSQIYVGFSANSSALTYKREIKRINSLVEKCKYSLNLFTPILHFSFSKSPEILKDLDKIDQLILNCRLQPNDFPDDLGLILTLSTYKRTHILPFSDESFYLLNCDKLLSQIIKSGHWILLDSSKGQGINANQNKLQEQINTLIYLGVDKIAVAGGFGPNNLDTYFYLRQKNIFPISIDAESGLKTGHTFDMEKVKIYLSQLLSSEKRKYT